MDLDEGTAPTGPVIHGAVRRTADPRSAPPPTDTDDRGGARAARMGRRAAGDRAEAYVATRLHAVGWRILARQVPVGRDELDLVAVEPGAAGDRDTLVFLEVRSARGPRFGAPEESVPGPKVRRTFRAALALLHAGVLPDGRSLPQLPWRVDLVSVTGLGGPGVRVRHLRAIDPG